MLYKKTKLPKKLLAVVLAALLMLALFPVTALAIDFTGSGNSTVTFQVGKYSEDTYDTSGTGVNPGVVSLVHESGTLPSGISFAYTQGNPLGTGTRSIYGTPAAGTVNTYPMQYYDVNNNIVKYTFTVVVEKGPVTIEQNDVTKSAADIGTTVQLTPTIKNGNGAEILSGSQDAPTLTYSSANPNVATVDANGLVTIQGVGTTTVTIDSIETGSYTAAQKVVTVTVNKANPAVSLVGAEPSGMVGAVDDKTVTVAVMASYNQNIDFTCDINGIQKTASRSGNGNVSFAFAAAELNTLAAGNYPITVSSEETANNNAIAGTVVGNLHVNQAPAINGPTSMFLTEGYAAASTGAYTITGWPDVTVTPSDARFTWDDTNKKLNIPAGLTKGTYTVTLTASNSILPDATLDFTLTVNEPAPPQDTVYPFTTNFGTYTGQSEGLTGIIDANISAFTGLEVNGQTLHGSNYSTNAGSTVITLHPSYLNTLDNGTYTIRALFTDGYAEGSFIVNRQDNAVSVTGVALDKSTASVTVDKTVQLTVTVSPSNATSKGVTWASSDTSIATVDANGKVKGVKSGTATITVTTDDGGYTATCKVTVTSSPQTGKVTVTKAAGSPQTGDSGNMMLWIITGLSSILIGLYLLVWRKRQQLKENA